MVFRVSDEKIWVFYSIHEKYLKEVEKNNSDLALTQFCLNYKVSSKALAMFLYRYRFKMESNPELYKKIKEFYEQFTQQQLTENLNINQFIKKYDPGFKLSHFSDYKLHVKYQQKIERLKNNPPLTDQQFLDKYWVKSPEKKPSRPRKARKSYYAAIKEEKIQNTQIISKNDCMPFIAVTDEKPVCEPQPQQLPLPMTPAEEVITPDNDIELIVKKGIRILVSSIVDEATILKLITTIRKL